MDKYEVMYRSTGLLSGKEPGDTVELDSTDAKHLLDLGVVRKAKAPAKAEDSKPAPKAAPKAGAK